MTIKELFEKGEDGTLTFEQFEKLMSESGAKFVDGCISAVSTYFAMQLVKPVT